MVTNDTPVVDKGREPELRPRELAAVVRDGLALPADERLAERPLVSNIKGYLGNLGRRYSFEFDLGRNNVAIEVIRAERYGSREKIRYLMAKARMLRYEVDGDRLHARKVQLHPVLVVDGKLARPDHDPYRYVRALLSVGWEPFAVDQLQSLREMLGHTFRQEMRTILLHFNGSPWATHAPVQDVIAQYGHFVASGETPTQTTRVSLQIFHASRAIDSFLAPSKA